MAEQASPAQSKVKGVEMIPRIDAQALIDLSHPENAAMQALVRQSVRDVGFLVLHNTTIPEALIGEVFDQYRAFFALPVAHKASVDMAQTASNRGWGAPQSEQVDPDANPDYKEVFDIGYAPREDDPLAALGLSVYAPNQWPDAPDGFRDTLKAYFEAACSFSRQLLAAIARSIGEDAEYFDDKFNHPMALLRGNFYPTRPEWAGEDDFGIAAHTDYGCLTLLATDGVAGLEILSKEEEWQPVSAQAGDFIINFGEMLEMWTNGRVKATLHRVKGTSEERISVPLFFNPNHDTNVAPIGSGQTIRAVDHLQKRFNETYVHLQKK